MLMGLTCNRLIALSGRGRKRLSDNVMINDVIQLLTINDKRSALLWREVE